MLLNKEQIERICTRATDLSDSNAPWQSYFQDLATYCLPRKAWVTSVRGKGDRLKLDQVYDSTAIRSLKIMAAGFHSNLTNPSSKWFNLRTRNLSIMDSKEAQLWFNDVEDEMFGTFASSNFDTTMQEFYLNSGCFGTGTILTLEDVEERVRFTEIPIEQVSFEEDSYGRVNRVYRTFPLTAQQAFDLWGEQAGEAVKETVKKKPNEQLKFLHYVGPRDKRNPARQNSANMPYMSVWIELSKKHLINEGGFVDNPYAVGRFYKDTADVFGFSPAMDVFPDIKLVQAQVKTMLRASMKAADPALIAPRKGFIAPLNANPGKINYYDKKSSEDTVTAFPNGGNFQLTIEVIKETQLNIEKAFFVPLFQAISNITKEMTVPEVQRRISENMVLLGPVVGRFTQEMLDPIVMRLFDILYRGGFLPPPPPSIQGQELDIVYISPLARAQKESDIYSIQAFMQDVGLIAQAKPEVLDKIDGDKMVDDIAIIRGISPELIKSDSDVESTRKQRADAQAQMMQAQQMQQGAEIVNTGSQAEKNMAEAKATKEE